MFDTPLLENPKNFGTEAHHRLRTVTVTKRRCEYYARLPLGPSYSADSDSSASTRPNKVLQIIFIMKGLLSPCTGLRTTFKKLIRIPLNIPLNFENNISRTANSFHHALLIVLFGITCHKDVLVSAYVKM